MTGPMEQGEPTPDDENTPRIPSPRAAGDDLTGGGRGGSGTFLPGPREGNRFTPPEPEPHASMDPEPHSAPEPDPEPQAVPEPEATVHEPAPHEAHADPPSHTVLKSLLGAWALAACSAEETDAVEAHLTECAPCADEALRLRDAVGLLHTERSLDLDPLLRSRVLENCLAGARPASRCPGGRPRTTRRPPGSTRCSTTSGMPNGTLRCG
ncbi:hypothetical protein GCM10010388_43780 [Streptomyces mauvecolor]